MGSYKKVTSNKNLKMKKFILLVIMLQTGVLFAQQSSKGKVRLYLHSVKCEKETADDWFDGDGKADEIFVTLFYSVASSNGTTKYINKFTTGVYGDNRIWPSRVKAGSAGSTGGIKRNDAVYLHPQTQNQMPIGDERFKGLKAFEADLDAGDIITIIPVLWEWDNNPTNTQNSFESYLWNAFNNVNVRMAAFTQRFDIKTANRQFTDQGSNSINMAGITQILRGVNGVPGNRPVGMALNASYNPQVIVLNANILENWVTVMQPNTGNSGNFFPVHYDEPSLGNNRDHGKYTLLLNPEFTKAAAQAPPAPTAANNLFVIRNGDRPAKFINQPTYVISSQVLVGNWAGTQTNDDGVYPQAILFELAAGGQYLSKDRNGVLAAKGSYTFSNNIITGSYKQLSSGEIFSFTGTYDPATQKLNCSQGSGSSTKGQGKWVVTKK